VQLTYIPHTWLHGVPYILIRHTKNTQYHSAINRPTQLLIHFSTLVLHKPISHFSEIGGFHLLHPFRGKFFHEITCDILSFVKDI
jgi:hypothetical protein